MMQTVYFENIKAPRFIYCRQQFIHTKPLTQQTNSNLVMSYLKLYFPSIISYIFTCTTINSLDQHPNFLADWMIISVTVLTVKAFNIISTCLLLTFYLSIWVMIFQVSTNPLHSNQLSITVTSSNQKKYYSLFSIPLTVIWRKCDT